MALTTLRRLSSGSLPVVVLFLLLLSSLYLLSGSTQNSQLFDRLYSVLLGINLLAILLLLGLIGKHIYQLIQIGRAHV